MTTAFIFPGQGSQSVGMGKEVYDSFAEARDVFEEVDEALGESLSKIIFDGPIEDLTLTQNTQPALMATSIAVLRVLEKQGGIDLKSHIGFAAGHSLGEYTALCATGAIPLAQTAKLLRTRGNAMQEAVPQGQGGMAAIIGVDIETAEAIAAEAAGDDVCEVANDNSVGQVVISGSAAAIERGTDIAKEKGAKKYVPLNVSAPFHCSLMKPAADVMRDALAKATVTMPVVPILANVSAEETMDPEQIRNLLVNQVTGRVRWRESIQALRTRGVTKTVEIGAGKVLSGLTKRIESDMEAVSIQKPDQIEAYLG